MDKSEIALQEEMQLRASVVEQPLEGLLYDLDLMPEQCKSGTANIRRIAIEVLRKEVERLRKVGTELIDKMCELCIVINLQHENCTYCDEKYNFEQALKGE